MTRSRLWRHSWVLAALLTLGLLAPLTTAQAEESSADDKIYEMRTKLLGEGWDKPDQVRGRWISVTTWLASFGGKVVLFDSTVMSFLTKSSNDNGYVSLDDVIAAKPDVIFQSHNHFDQARHSSRIAAATRSPLVTTLGGCLFAKRDALLKGLGADNIRCNLVRDSKGKPFTGLDTYVSPYGGEGLVFTPFGAIGKPEKDIPGLKVTAVLIKHSQVRPYPDDLLGPRLKPDLKPLLNDPPKPATLVDFGMTQDIDNGNILYMVEYNGFKLLHHGSTGSLNPLEPGQAAITKSLRSLGTDDRVDVEIGGIAELNYFANGFVESRRYSEAIGAKYYFPTHHNSWLPPATNEAAYYYEPWKKEMESSKANKFPELCFLTEKNWATVWSFNTSDWSGDRAGEAKPLDGPGCYEG